MKCSVVRSSSPLVNERLQAVEDGLRRNAVEVEVFVDRFDVGGDFAVTWGAQPGPARLGRRVPRSDSDR